MFTVPYNRYLFMLVTVTAGNLKMVHFKWGVPGLVAGHPKVVKHLETPSL